MKALYRSDNPSLIDALVLYYGNNIVAGDGSIKAIPYLVNQQTLYLEYRYITSLEGLEIFESLDISKNVALETLWIPGNKLTELDLSSNDNLISLYCQVNLLKTLDVS